MLCNKYCICTFPNHRGIKFLILLLINIQIYVNFHTHTRFIRTKHPVSLEKNLTNNERQHIQYNTNTVHPDSLEHLCTLHNFREIKTNSLYYAYAT